MFSHAAATVDHAQREPELGDRAGRLDHRGAAGHVALHVLHVQRRLERDAARVEGDRLADEAERRRRRVGARAARSAARSGAAGLCAALRDRGEARPCPARRSRRGPSASAVEVLGAGGDLARALGEPLRRQLVRRAVDEVAGAVRPARRSRQRSPAASSTPSASPQRTSVEGFEPGSSRLPAARVVGAEERARRRAPAPARPAASGRESSITQAIRSANAVGLVRDGGSGRAERIRVDALARSDPAPATRRAPSLPSTCTMRARPGRRAARRRSPDGRAGRRDRRRAPRLPGAAVAVGDGDSEDVGLDLLRRNGFDLDLHRAARCYPTAPPSLSLGCGLHLADALAPIVSSWHAAQPMRPLARTRFRRARNRDTVEALALRIAELVVERQELAQDDAPIAEIERNRRPDRALPVGARARADRPLQCRGRSRPEARPSYPRPRAGRARQTGDGGAVGRPSRDRLRERRAARAAAVLRRSLRRCRTRSRRRSMLASAASSSLDPAALRALVRPPRRALAAAGRSRGRRHRDRARRRRAVLLARAPAGRRLGPRRRGLPPRGLEVRRLRERQPAGERDERCSRSAATSATRSARSTTTPLVVCARPARRASARAAVPRGRRRPARRCSVPRGLRARGRHAAARRPGRTGPARWRCCSA